MDPQEQSLRARLLVASPALVDPSFARTVVLVAEHGEEGAMGVVLNRPSEAPVAEAVPPLEDLVAGGAVVHVGGPVEPTAVLVLAEWDDTSDVEELVFGDVGFLPGDRDPTVAAAATRRLRVFAGYSGWGPGQLEHEIEEGSWIAATPRNEDVFGDEPLGLWSRVLRRKGGRYAFLSLMPLDPSVN